MTGFFQIIANNLRCEYNTFTKLKNIREEQKLHSLAPVLENLRLLQNEKLYLGKYLSIFSFVLI